MNDGDSNRLTRRTLLWLASAPVASAFLPRVGEAAGEWTGQYSGAVKDLTGGCIFLSSDGQNVLAYYCDGTDAHPPTVSNWIRGQIEGNSVRITKGGVTLFAQFHSRSANGAVTLADGTFLPFRAHSRWPDGSTWALYRGEAEFGGARYVGGWISHPVRVGEQSLPAVFAASWSGLPSYPAQVADFDDVDDDWPHTGGGIVNQQTGAVLPYVAPNLTTMTAEVPGLGTFHLHGCLQANCTS
jgi:hypothetical protein